MPFSEVDTGDLSELWLGNPVTLAQVGEAIEIPELPSGTRGTFETTHLQSGSYKEFKKLRRKEGEEVTITGNALLGSTTDTLLRAAEARRDGVPYKIVVFENDDEYEITGTALVMNYKVTNPPEDRRTFEVTLKWLDEAVPAAAAAA